MKHINKIIFVHSNIIKGLRIVHEAGQLIDRNNIYRGLTDFLGGLSSQSSDGIIFPAFNYDYCKTGFFRPNKDPVQVGALPEWVRKNFKFVRSHMPVFSVLSSVKANFVCNQITNPFGKGSIFDWLVDKDASIVLFGADLSSLTFVHYVEEMSGMPIYRYDKVFHGKILTESKNIVCKFKMHVRPKGINSEYDWPKLESDLLNAGILKIYKGSNYLKILNTHDLLDYWIKKISIDPFYLLDAASKDIFKRLTKNGKHRVKLEDFE